MDTVPSLFPVAIIASAQNVRWCRDGTDSAGNCVGAGHDKPAFCEAAVDYGIGTSCRDECHYAGTVVP